MANLAEAVDATETDWIISADLDDDIDYLTVEDEIVHVTANFPAQYQAATGTTSVPRIRVERGAGGTTAASHADTTALTPLIPPSSSGIPDPAGAPDGQVPTTESGAYSLTTSEGIGPVQVVARTLTSAEILALFTTPIELVAGVAGKVFWPVSAFLHFNVVTTPYEPGAGAPKIGIGVNVDANLFATTVVILGPSVDQSFQLGPVDVLALDDSSALGEPMKIWATEQDPTVGDGTLDVTVLYRLMTVPLPPPAPAASLAFTVQPSNVVFFESITPAVTVTALNAENDPAPPTTVTISLNEPGTLGGDLVQDTANGVATFSDLSVEETGTFTLDATAGALSDTSDSFVVDEGAP